VWVCGGTTACNLDNQLPSEREKHNHYNYTLHIANQPQYSRPTYRLYVQYSRLTILQRLPSLHLDQQGLGPAICMMLVDDPQPCPKHATIMTLWVVSFNGCHPHDQFPTG